MNKHDSERISGLLIANGYKQTKDPDKAQILIFNTCAVRDHAERRFFGNLNNYRARKKREPDMIIAVGGCIAQTMKNLVFEKAPHVDIVFGTHNLHNLIQTIESVRKSRFARCDVSDTMEIMPTSLPLSRYETRHAWVPIIIGCNNFCSYCIVPYARGREASRSADDIVAEVENLVADGVKDITLLGQNVNSYRHEKSDINNDTPLKSNGTSDFASLLRALDKIDGLRRIRFTTSHPKDFSSDILKAMAAGKKICEHIHLPVQAGSNRILKAMNRMYTKEKYLDIVKKIYETIPGIGLTSDIMVGFPGETEEDFLETLDVVEKVRYDAAFTFVFSPREGTPAAAMSNQISDPEKSYRFERLVTLQNKISFEKNSDLVGKYVEVFIEGLSKKDDKVLSGRTRTNKIVNFRGPRELVHAEASILITEAFTWHLSGELADTIIKK